MSAWLRKTTGLPGSAPGGLEWKTPDDVVEVMDEALAADLLEIPGAGFVSVAAPDDTAGQSGDGEGQQEQSDAESESDGKGASAGAGRTAKKAAASRGAAKTPVQE